MRSKKCSTWKPSFPTSGPMWRSNGEGGGERRLGPERGRNMFHSEVGTWGEVSIFHGTVEDPPSQAASSPSGAQLTTVNVMAHWSHVTGGSIPHGRKGKSSWRSTQGPDESAAEAGRDEKKDDLSSGVYSQHKPWQPRHMGCDQAEKSAHKPGSCRCLPITPAGQGTRPKGRRDTPKTWGFHSARKGHMPASQSPHPQKQPENRHLLKRLSISKGTEYCQ